MRKYQGSSYRFNVERVRVSQHKANGGSVCWDLHQEHGKARCLNVSSADTYMMPGTHVIHNEVPKFAKVAPITATSAAHSNIACALREEIQKGEGHADQLRVTNICFLLSTLESMVDSSCKTMRETTGLQKIKEALLSWKVPDIHEVLLFGTPDAVRR